MRFIVGADEIAINAEMGLYKQFEMTEDGIIYGCRGLEIFNQTMGQSDKGLYAVWSTPPDSWGPYEPECPKQTIEHPAGSGEPLFTIFEEFAANQKNFVRDFFPALEKMSANGYPEGLTNAPDHWTGVSCPIPADNNKPFTCYKTEAAGTGDPFVIQASWARPEVLLFSKILSQETHSWALLILCLVPHCTSSGSGQSQEHSSSTLGQASHWYWMGSQPGALKHCRHGKENRLLSEVRITQAKDSIPGLHGLVRQGFSVQMLIDGPLSAGIFFQSRDNRMPGSCKIICNNWRNWRIG